MKKKLLTVALAAVMVVSTAINSFAATTYDDGLVGYYTFDDSLNNSVADGAAKLHGGAGDTWNADATGTAAYLPGKNGKAYSFTGDGTARGEGLELDVKLTEAFTISFWVNADKVSSATSMVFVPVSLDTGINIADNWFGNTFPTVRIWGVADNTDVYLDNWTPLKDGSATDREAADFYCGQWKYITLTGDKDGNVALYVDGVSCGTDKTNVAAFKDMPIFLGINFWDASFDGLMDDVAVYNKALSADEVKALYTKGGVPATTTDGGNGGDVTPPPTNGGNGGDVTPPPTGDATMVGLLLAVAAVSAVVVLKKKTVTE